MIVDLVMVEKINGHVWTRMSLLLQQLQGNQNRGNQIKRNKTESNLNCDCMTSQPGCKILTIFIIA